VRENKRVRTFIKTDKEGDSSNVAAAEEAIVFGDFDGNWAFAFPTSWDNSKKKLPFTTSSARLAHISKTPHCDARNAECKQAMTTFCKIDPRACGNAPPPTPARHDIHSSCNIATDGHAAHFWSFNPRKERGHFTIHCQNGFKDEMPVEAGEFDNGGAAQPGHYRKDGWFYHGWVTQGPGLQVTSCSTDFVGTNGARVAGAAAACARAAQPPPPSFRACAAAGAAARIGQDLSGSFHTGRYSGMFVVRVWNECGKTSVTWNAGVHGEAPVEGAAGAASGDIVAWTSSSNEHLFAIVERVDGDELTVIQGAHQAGRVARETLTAHRVWHYRAE
jgi:hypothetical protein